jgi:hypothetical protein
MKKLTTIELIMMAVMVLQMSLFLGMAYRMRQSYEELSLEYQALLEVQEKAEWDKLTLVSPDELITVTEFGWRMHSYGASIDETVEKIQPLVESKLEAQRILTENSASH